MTYSLVNKLTARPGQRADVVELLLRGNHLAEDDPACIASLVFESVEDEQTVYVVDVWVSRAAHETAMQNPELRPLIDACVPLLEAMPQQTEVTLAGGKGTPI